MNQTKVVFSNSDLFRLDFEFGCLELLAAAGAGAGFWVFQNSSVLDDRLSQVKRCRHNSID